MALIGFAKAVMVASLLAGHSEPGDSVRCVRTTRWFPEIRQSVHCLTPAELAAWQQEREARRLAAAALAHRAADRQAERRMAAERQWRARQERRRYELWLEERRREERWQDDRQRGAGRR